MACEGDAPQLGVLLVGGAGGIGRSAHLPAIQASPLLRLVGVVDVDEEGLAEIERLAGCWTSTDLGAALEREDIDLVDICSPDFAHTEQAIAAVRAGKHVICEKPLALSVADALSIKDAVAAAGVKFMVAQVMRFQSRWRSLKAEVARGSIGRPVFVRVWVRGRPFSYPADSFYRKPESIGPIVHNGMHYFDLASWFADSLPAWVYAVALSRYPDGDRLPGENYWSVQIGFESGAMGQVEYNFAALEIPPDRTEMGALVVGTRGTLSSAPEAARPVELADAEGFSWPGSHPPRGWIEAFRAELEHFARCIIEDREPDVGLEWSVHVLATCMACMQSAHRDEPVQVSSILSGPSPPQLEGRGGP